MRNSILVFVLVFGLSAAADDDCTLSADALKGQVDGAKLPKGAKLSGKRDEKSRAYSETIEYADGTKVTLGIGGCAHLGLSFELKSKAVKGIAPKDAVALLLKQLDATPVKENATLRPKIFSDALKKLKEAPKAFPVKLPCGEFEDCQLNLEQDEGASVLRLGYDFAM